MAYQVTRGPVHTPLKVVLYGPEGIGKSTFASKFPAPVFIDTEGGTKKLNVARLPTPTSWAMLLDEVAEVRKGAVPCGTLVLDTADWAERLCIRAVCDRAGKAGIEDFGYGKGYTYVKEEFARLLDALEEVVDSGPNVVVTAHAQIVKFEQPDEMGAYDRWQLKVSKQVAPLLREWCDMLLFANYKTVVVKDGAGPNAKAKAQGGRRVLYTTHHPCWDAKNRDGLPDELPLDYSAIAPVVPVPGAAGQATPPPPAQPPRQTPEQMGFVPEPGPAPFPDAPAPDTPENAAAPAEPAEPPGTAGALHADLAARLAEARIPKALAQLMLASGVEPDEVQEVVAQRGYFPADMPVADYPADFVDGCLVAAWQQVQQMIYDRRSETLDDLPF